MSSAREPLLEEAQKSPAAGKKISLSKKIFGSLALLVFPLIAVVIFICAVPLSGSYWIYDTVNRHIFAWYLLGIYYVTTILLPALTLRYTLHNIPLGWLFVIEIPMFILVPLVTEFIELSSEARFAFATVGLAYNVIVHAVIDIYERVRHGHGIPAKHWIVAGVSEAASFGMYYFATVLANTSIGQDAFVQTVLSVSYQVVGYIFRLIVWNMARLHSSFENRRQLHVGHMNVVVSHLIFYVFYRVIFEEFTSPTPFIVSQIFNVVLEVIVYVVLLFDRVQLYRERALNWVKTTLKRFLAFGCGCFSCTAGLIAPSSEKVSDLSLKSIQTAGYDPVEAKVYLAERERSLSHETRDEEGRYLEDDGGLSARLLVVRRTELFRQTAIEYMLRHFCNLVSLAAYLVLACIYHYVPYVTMHFQTLDLSGLLFIGVSGVCDLALIAVVTLVWARRFHRSLWSHWWGFLRRPQYIHYWFVFFAGLHVQMDVVLATIRLS